MALKDFLPPDARRDQDPELKRNDPETPEVRRRGDWFNQVPNEYKSWVEDIAKTNHRHYAERFPSFDDFLDAVAESWMEKKRVFEEETRRQGFVPIEPGTKAGELNKDALAYLTAHGSLFLFGPHAFEKNVAGSSGAAVSYVKIPFRQFQGLLEDIDQPAGAFIMEMPKLGNYLPMRGVRSGSRGPHSDQLVFTSTAPVIAAMRKHIAAPEQTLPALSQAKTGLTRVFEGVHQEAGLALARPGRNDPAKK